MVRGGQREGAGRKSTWESGAKFEDTVLLRVPRNIRDELLTIAHKLDAGEKFDNETKSKVDEETLEQQIKLNELMDNNELLHQSLLKERLELETKSRIYEEKLRFLELSNQQLSEQIKSIELELETKSKQYQGLIKDLEQKNFTLHQLLNESNTVKNSEETNILTLVKEILKSWNIQKEGLPPVTILSLTTKMVDEINAIIADKHSKISLDSNTKPLQKNAEIEPIKNLVTKSVTHTQLGLLDLENSEETAKIEPLTAIQLSRRFNKNDQFIKTKKNYYKGRSKEFFDLLKQYDPQGISWKYSEIDKKYHPIVDS